MQTRTIDEKSSDAALSAWRFDREQRSRPSESRVREDRDNYADPLDFSSIFREDVRIHVATSDVSLTPRVSLARLLNWNFVRYAAAK